MKAANYALTWLVLLLTFPLGLLITVFCWIWYGYGMSPFDWTAFWGFARHGDLVCAQETDITLVLTDDSHPDRRKSWERVSVAACDLRALRRILKNERSPDDLIIGLRELDFGRDDGVFWDIADEAEKMDLPVLEIKTT